MGNALVWLLALLLSAAGTIGLWAHGKHEEWCYDRATDLAGFGWLYTEKVGDLYRTAQVVGTRTEHRTFRCGVDRVWEVRE